MGSSIARKQAAAYTPGTADQIIGANQYLAGPQTIKGDPDLKAENIKSGGNFFGVDGSDEGQRQDSLCEWGKGYRHTEQHSPGCVCAQRQLQRRRCCFSDHKNTHNGKRL